MITIFLTSFVTFGLLSDSESSRWNSSEQANTVESYLQCQKDFPKGQHVIEAAARVGQLRSVREMRRAGLGSLSDPLQRSAAGQILSFLATHSDGTNEVDVIADGSSPEVGQTVMARSFAEAICAHLVISPAPRVFSKSPRRLETAVPSQDDILRFRCFGSVLLRQWSAWG